MTYRYLPHTADLKVEIKAVDLPRLFSEACYLARDLLVGDSHVTPTMACSLELQAPGTAELLFGFLREILYRFATDGFVPTRYAVKRVTQTTVTGMLEGETFDPRRHEAQPEVKAVTRHELQAEQVDGGWCATVVFDL